MITAICISGIALASYYAIPSAVRLMQQRSLQSACTSRRHLVLTFDDGPGKELTPQVMQLLEKYHAKATFFLLGRRVLGAPEIVDQLVAAGHEVACHTQCHRNAWRTLPWVVLSDVQAGYQTLSRWIPKSGLFRPPYGKMILPTMALLKHQHAHIAWWTLDSKDTWSVLPEAATITDRLAQQGGGVVLLHDFDRGPERARYVLETTEILLQFAQQNQFTVCRYSDLLPGSSVPVIDE